MKRLEKRIWLSSPTMHGDEQKYVKEAFDANWIAPLGPNVDRFEKEMSEYLGIEGTSAVVSGTAALHLTYKLAGIEMGDIVLVQDLTFSATINPIIYERAIPVFIDSEYQTWNMDPKALEIALEKYKDKVKAVIVVNLYGTPAQLDQITALCDKYKVTLIEDAAESLSSKYKGRQTGTFGKYNAISFNGNKIMTTSGGGMVLTHYKESAKKAHFWATQAREKTPWYQHNEIGYNYRLSNVLAGIGVGQLMHLEEHKNLKTKIFNKYNEAFKEFNWTMNPYLDEMEPNFWLSSLLLGDKDIENGFTPNFLREELEKYNIESRNLWKPMHLQPIFESFDYIKATDKSVSEDLFRRGICLPSDIKMNGEQQEFVIEQIKKIYKENEY